MSGAGKAMAPILSEGDLATITPSSTNPDITNPKFADQYRPAGKPIYFRTVTTDAYQGPNMANFMAEKLGVKNVYVLDDSGAYGVGLADAFQAQADKKGIKVLGRDRLDPKAADYSAILTKIKSLNPQAIYYGGVGQAGIKLAKQAYDIMPNVIKAGGDGVYGATFLTGAGFPAAEGWYATIASPHLTGGDHKAAEFVKSFTGRFGIAPEDYSITAYDARAGHHRCGEAGCRQRQAGDPRARCATRSRPPRCRPSRALSRSTPTATWRTAPSACSRSSRTRPASRTTSRRSTTTSTWRRRPDRGPVMAGPDPAISQAVGVSAWMAGSRRP